MLPLPEHIIARMESLASRNSVRSLRLPLPDQIDFTSNDYLGLAHENDFQADLSGHPAAMGSGGSRLLSGNHTELEALEAECAELFQTESCLLYSSGYMANLGLISCIAGNDGVILFDELAHASIRDGLRLARADSFSFRHQDCADLERLLQLHGPGCFIVVEALYSMDGDLLDLEAICALAEKHQSWLIVDEAHSTGLYGQKGAGWVIDQGFGERVWLRVHTFGKAVGRQGAVIAGPKAVRDFLINRSRTQIFSTAMPPAQAIQIRGALQKMQAMEEERDFLIDLRRLMEAELAGIEEISLPRADSPIVPIILPGNARVKAAAALLQADGFDVRPILPPTVPKGSERLRVILHSFNSKEEVISLAKAIRQYLGIHSKISPSHVSKQKQVLSSPK
jgi:8-amino-7-oxononanoate synthase